MNKIENTSDKSLFIFIFLSAFIFRTYAAFTSIAQLYPDEIFQTVEMAHKIVFGKAITYWEFEVGARSWVFPGIIAGVYKILNLIGIDDPYYLNGFVKAFLGIFHSLAVSSFYLISKRWFKDKSTAFIFTVPLTLNYFLSYISARTLTESIALPFMIFSVHQAIIYIEKYKLKYLLLSAFFAGIAFMLRFQTAVFAFGIALSFLTTSRKHIKTSLVFGFSYIGMMAVQGIIDKFTWGSFMHSLITYLDYNISKGVANKHGVSPWYFYLQDIASTVSPITYITAGLFCIFIIIMMKKRKKEFLFLFPFLFFFIVHCIVQHKEPRFVFPFFFPVFALSSAFFATIYERYKNFYILSLSILLILISYTQEAINFRTNWNSSTVTREFYGKDDNTVRKITGSLEISMYLYHIKDLKEAYIYGVPRIWSGGYAYFHKNSSITYSTDENDLVKNIKIKKDSCINNTYFAIRKGTFKKIKHYNKTLKKYGETKDFDVYKLITENKKKNIKYSRLPKNTKKASAWCDNGNIIMCEQGVDISFDTPQNGTEISIAVDSSDKYQLIFKRNNNTIDKIILPAKKRDRGMYVHTIKLPEKLVHQEFDAIEVTPLQGDRLYSLGSIKIK